MRISSRSMSWLLSYITRFDDAEMNVLVDEIRGEVERIFHVDCRKRALNAALEACKGDRSAQIGCGQRLFLSG
jgi:hypothetical protein